MTAWDQGFSTPRIGLLQPGLRSDELDKAVERSSEKIVLDSYCTTVRLWADSHPEIPRGRLEKAFAVTAAGRQPVSQLVVETQVVEREIVQRLEPCRSGTVDTRPLSTGTPLTIIPLEEASFPVMEVTTDHRLIGGESVHDCTGCNATGHLNCGDCGQTGRVLCGACNGQKRLRCGGCGGTGRRMLANGVIVNCPTCAGLGGLTCTQCDVNAHVTCSRCNGDGYLTCGMCAGFARVCQFHVLVSKVSTHIDHVFHYAEEWPLDLDGLVSEMEEVWQEVVLFESPSGRTNVASFDVDAYSPPVPPRIMQRLHEYVQAALIRGVVDQTKGITATAVRFVVRGCYVHRVGYSLDGKDANDSIYIGGLGNRVAPGKVHDKFRSSMAWLQRPIHGLLRGIGILESDGPSGRFKKRLKETDGKVHLLDTNAVVADAAEAIGLNLEVSDYGYRFDSTTHGAIGDVDLTHDASKTNLMVGFVLKLGTARRDQFVMALEFNDGLVFGRIGLVMNADTGALEFGIYDTRLYADLTAEMYAAVLRFLIEVAMPRARANFGG